MLLGWGFLRLLLHLQLRSLSRGVPNSHLKMMKRLILGHIWINSWKFHACYAVLGYTRNNWHNTLYKIVNILHFCVSVAVSGDFCYQTVRKCTKFYSLLSFLPWTWPQLGGLPHLETFTWQIVTSADRVTLPSRPGNLPGWVTPPIM